jgi:hypothetical protein
LIICHQFAIKFWRHQAVTGASSDDDHQPDSGGQVGDAGEHELMIPFLADIAAKPNPVLCGLMRLMAEVTTDP